MPWAIALGVVGGALISSDASQSAADTQAASANASTALQGDIYNKTSQNIFPWLQGGQLSLQQLNTFLGQGGSGMMPEVGNPGATIPVGTPSGTNGITYGMGLQQFDPSKLATDPGYQFQLNQGLDAVKNQASSLGGVNSGATLKSLNDYAQGLASTNYQQAFNNWNTTLNNIFARLTGTSGSGQSAAVQQGGFGQNFGANAGENAVGAGNALAAGQVGSANALNSGINGLSNAWITSRIAGTGGGTPVGTPPYGSGGSSDPLSQYGL